VATRKQTTSTPDPDPDPTRERLTVLAEDCVRLMVQGIGGFPKTNNGKMMRQMVRELREMYAEIEQPAPRGPVTAAGIQVASAAGGEFDDIEEEDF
jgi:NifB/MoaA-like Fe-S oxidoreductase